MIVIVIVIIINTTHFGKFLLGLTLREVTGGESRLFGVLARVFVNVIKVF